MDESLDTIWKALSDATRRDILDLLREGPRRTTELVEAFPHLSRFGVMKHLDVLKQCELVTAERNGREVTNRLNPVPLRRVYERWVSRYHDLWSDNLLRVKELAESSLPLARTHSTSPEDDEMAYSKETASRVRAVLKGRKGLTERAMFGGVAFMINGHMCCGVATDNLVLRLGEQGATEALNEPQVSPMDFTGKPMKTMVYVSSKGYARDANLKSWIDRAVKFVRTLPPKT